MFNEENTYFQENHQEEIEHSMLKNEIEKDSRNNGPMKVIFESLQNLVSQIDLTELIDKNSGYTTVRKQEFSFNKTNYTLELTASKVDDSTFNIRFSILAPSIPREQIDNKSNKLHLKNGEHAFRSFLLENINGVIYISGYISASPTAERGLAKSLILSSHYLIRFFMNQLDLDTVEASIGDASENDWSNAMAQRLGYTVSEDFSDLFLYTYRK